MGNLNYIMSEVTGKLMEVNNVVTDKNSTNATKSETEGKSEIQIIEISNPTKAKKVKPEPVLLEFGNCRSDFNAPKASKTGTLQDSFNRFRKKKIEKHKYKNYLKEKANAERRDPAF